MNLIIVIVSYYFYVYSFRLMLAQFDIQKFYLINPHHKFIILLDKIIFAYNCPK